MKELTANDNKVKVKHIPNTKQRVLKKTLIVLYFILPFSSTVLLSPARYDIYKGSSGKTHGDKNDKIPSKNIPNNVISILS